MTHKNYSLFKKVLKNLTKNVFLYIIGLWRYISSCLSQRFYLLKKSKMTKKLLKIGVLCCALLSCVFVLSTQNVEAESVNTAKVKLTDGTSTCTWVDFDFWSAIVSGATQKKTTSWTINCTFKKSTGEKVTYKLDNLVNTGNSSYNIALTNVKLKGGTVTVSAWNLTTTSALTTLTAFQSSTISQKVYTRTYDKLGTMSQKIELELTIPAWTPAWVYSGSITLDIEEGN